MPEPIHVDFSQSNDFELLDAGLYEGKIAATEVKPGQNAPYINWTIEVPRPSGNGVAKVWLVTSLSPGAAWKLRETLVALGEDAESLKGSDVGVDIAQYVGRPCRVLVSQETYQGRLQNRAESLYASEAPAGPTIA